MLSTVWRSCEHRRRNTRHSHVVVRVGFEPTNIFRSHARLNLKIANFQSAALTACISQPCYSCDINILLMRYIYKKLTCPEFVLIITAIWRCISGH